MGNNKAEFFNAFPTVDIREYLKNKDVDFGETDNWYKMRCLMPEHDDHTPSFYIHKIHGGFNCYGCKESGSWGKMLGILGWEQDESIKIGVINSAIWSDTEKYINKLKNKGAKYVYNFPPPAPYKLVGKSDIRFYSYLKRRNLHDLREIFKIGYCSSGKTYGGMYRNRILIPVHDDSGKYLWTEGRTILDKKRTKYYRPENVRSTNHLFNFHRIKHSSYIVVVEGILDAMTLYKYGFPAVCSFGANLSDRQIIDLVGFDKVVLAFDNDTAGIKGYVKSKKKLSGIGIDLFRVILPKKQDSNSLPYKYVYKKFSKPTKII